MNIDTALGPRPDTGPPDRWIARLSGVSLRYGAVEALAAVDLTLPRGASVALIGPDGVGKSSILALVAGARAIQTGTVQVLGGDMADARHRRRTCPRIAYMPQGLGRNLYMDLSVAENIAFFARLFGLGSDALAIRRARLLTATGLEPFADRPAGKLSGGMKQKLGLCCALIHDPDLLILDEPTTGVDPLSRRQFWELIDTLRAERPAMSVIVATAYMEEAGRFDHIIAMSGGRILATGAPGALLERTGARDLDGAFIALLPAAQGEERSPLVIPDRPILDGPPAIEAHGLTRRFGDFLAVDHVDFAIPRGEIYGFLGSNGCGKTTTMKMLTGLLPASEGAARLLGAPVDAGDLASRRRVGYMSQSFSLYGELSVRENLVLHARLFHLDADQAARRIDDLVARFGLGAHLDAGAADLPLGVRQRLSLAVAVLHEPEVLILDEPTSGVDPLARDAFWRLLIGLSREQGVTIFVSTHFMNEAARCDRISLMHGGRVLVSDTPARLAEAHGGSLETAFIHHLEAVAGGAVGGATGGALAATPQGDAPSLAPREGDGSGRTARHGWAAAATRTLAVARRESFELLRDPIRLVFAMAGTVFLMLFLGYGLSFDVDKVRFAVLDQDRSLESTVFLEAFRGSGAFIERPEIRDEADLDQRLRADDFTLALDVPSGFGRDLLSGKRPEIRAVIDGAMPFRAETIEGYLAGAGQILAADLAARGWRIPGAQAAPAADLQVRLRYNQDFKSVYAIAPSTIAVLLVLIPSILTALAVVREKELGSITNLYVTPLTRLEFLIGKQAPYAVLALINCLAMIAVAIGVFGVPLKGSLAALLIAALPYVVATTAIGLLMSSFTKSQVAALFGTALATMTPSIQFSGYITPVSSLDGMARAIGAGFPTTHFMRVSVGVFTKALDLGDLGPSLGALCLFGPILVAGACLLLSKQEA